MSSHVLVLAPDVPYPPCYGGRVDNYYLLDLLKRMGFQIYLIFSYHREEEVPAALEHLDRICQAVFPFRKQKSPLSALHWSKPYYALSNLPGPGDMDKLDAFIGENCSQVTRLIICQAYMYEIALTVKDKLPLPADILYRMQNHEALFFKSLFADATLTQPKKLLFLLEWLRMRRYEKKVIHGCRRTLSISEAECKALGQAHPQLDIRWLPALYRPRLLSEAELTPEERQELYRLERRYDGRQVILFAGSFSDRFNVNAVEWFLKEVLPLIVEECPRAIFVFGGFCADEYFDGDHGRNAELFSNVPSVTPYLMLSDLNVVLTWNRAGVKLKLVEALQNGKKVVSTTEGVYGSGLEAYVPHSNHPQIFASHCIHALRSEIDYQPSWQASREIYSEAAVGAALASAL